MRDFARAAVAELHHARLRLEAQAVRAGDVRDKRHVVEATAERLASLAMHDDCPGPLSRQLLDWRDHLGSFALAARALDDLDVHHDVADQLLRRGIAEVLAESPERAVTVSAID